jgi:hypothetical protein
LVYFDKKNLATVLSSLGSVLNDAPLIGTKFPFDPLLMQCCQIERNFATWEKSMPKFFNENDSFFVSRRSRVRTSPGCKVFATWPKLTRFICQKGDQNVAQTGFLTKLLNNLYGCKKKLKQFVNNFCNLQKNYPKKTIIQ